MTTKNGNSIITCRYTRGDIILHIETNNGAEISISLTAKTAMLMATDLNECANKKLMAQAIQEFYALSLADEGGH